MSPAELAPAPEPAAPLVAIVLAAGLSRRMGARNKLLLPIAGAPMVARVVDALLASATFRQDLSASSSASAPRVLVVTGHQPEAVRAALAGRPLKFVHNPGFAEGLGSSLAVGVRAATARDPAGVLVALADMPWLQPATVDALAGALDPAGGPQIIAPRRAGRRGNPVLWSRAFLPDLQRMSGDAGPRELLRARPDALRLVEVEDDGVLRDVDTPEMIPPARV